MSNLKKRMFRTVSLAEIQEKEKEDRAIGAKAEDERIISLIEVQLKKMNDIFHEDTVGAENVLKWLKAELKQEVNPDD